MITGMSHVRSGQPGETTYYYLSDGQGWSLDTEVRKAVVERLRGDKPSTILGILMDQPKAPEDSGREMVAMEDLAEMAGRTLTDTETIVDFLAEDALAFSITGDDGTQKAGGFAYYTEKNEANIPTPHEAMMM